MPVTLRSYVLGAVHQALGLVWSEGIAVDADGAPLDLTIRSFGILSARDMPEVRSSCTPMTVGRSTGPMPCSPPPWPRRGMAEGLPPPVAHPPHRSRPTAPCTVAVGTITRGAPMSPAVGPYSPVRRAGDWVITSGQVGLATDADGAAAPAPGWHRRPSCHQALANVTAVLGEEGATWPTWSRPRSTWSTWPSSPP